MLQQPNDDIEALRPMLTIPEDPYKRTHDQGQRFDQQVSFPIPRPFTAEKQGQQDALNKLEGKTQN